MEAKAADRTGVMILRVWIEAGPHDAIRARITQTLDATGQERAIATAAGPEDIYAAVRTWVEAFVGPN